MSTFPVSARNGCKKREDRGEAFFQINVKWLGVSNLMSISFYHPTTGWLPPNLRMGSICFLHSPIRLLQIARSSPLCLFSLRLKKTQFPQPFLIAFMHKYAKIHKGIWATHSTQSPTCLYASWPDF